MAHPQAVPRVPSIDRENCVHFTTGECGLCSKVCGAGAIDYEQRETTVELDVGAVLLTPGFTAFDPRAGSNTGRRTIKMSYQSAVRAAPFRGRAHQGPCPPAFGRRRRRSTSPLSSAWVRATRLRQRLLFLGLLHGRDQGGHSRKAARTRNRRHHLLHGHARLRQGLRPVLNRAKEMGVSYVRCRPSSVEEVERADI